MSHSESVVVLDTGATANLVCYKWLGDHNRFLERQELEKPVPYPSNARFKFGEGRIAEVQHAADIKGLWPLGGMGKQCKVKESR